MTFYVDVNAFFPQNLMIMKADISKTSPSRYLFLFIFMCGNSKCTRIQKIKNFSGEVNWVHQALNTCMSYCPKIGDNEKNNGTGSHTIPLLTPLLHRNSTVARRVTTARTERGVRLTVCQGDVS